MITFFREKKKRKLVIELSVLIAAILTLLWLVFRPGETQREISYTSEEARLVGQITQGTINSTDDIRVHFNRKMVEASMVNQPFTKNIFSFTPAVDGTCYWESGDTLVFKTNRQLKKHQSYQGKLDLPLLLPPEESEKFKSLAFAFDVAGLEINSYSADFQVPDMENPEWVLYQGGIAFTEIVDLESVKKSTTLTMDGKAMPLIWERGKSEMELVYKTDRIRRELSRKFFVLQIKKNLLEMSADFERRFSLDPLTEFYPIEVLVADEQQKPVLKVAFNDQLHTQQDIRGLISVTPKMEVNPKISSKEVFLVGDFQFGQTYTVSVSPGIRSRWGTKTRVPRNYEIQIADLKPALMFASDGFILPSANQETIRFKTINLARVYLVIKKVYENNLYFFLQSEQVASAKDRHRGFNEKLANRVGAVVASRVLEIDEKMNVWLQHEIDLKKILPADEKGLLLICISSSASILTGKRIQDQENEEEYDEEEGGSPREENTVFKPVIRSDIGLTCKNAGNRYYVYATNILTAKPMEGASVSLKSFQNQTMARATTDGRGMAVLDNPREGVFFIEAEKSGQRNVIKPNEMAWNLSSFDVAGEKPDFSGIRAFIYTERGVYRPGDEINLSLIARNEQNTFPEDHPITLEIRNPKNQVVFQKTQKQGKDGFYSFCFRTGEDAWTGNWRASFQVGSRTFDHTLKIETIVPYRLKLKLDPDKSHLTPSDKKIRLNLASTYLMGNPSPGLAASIQVEVSHSPKQSSRFPGFHFTSEAVFYKPVTARIFEGRLDVEGKAHAEWDLPRAEAVPSALNLFVTTEVIEKGGRPVRHTATIPWDPYEFYVGLEKPERYGPYFRSGEPISFRAICIHRDGESAAGRTLTYRIYKNNRYWWWEYDSREKKQYAFKTDTGTELVKEGSVVSKKVAQAIQFVPEDYGQYLVEVSEGSGRGHTAGFFIRACYEGEGAVSPRDAGMLLLKSDKKTYHPGEEAVISFPTPREGMILLTIEKGTQILKSDIYTPSAKERETRIKIPITAEMLPNVYASVSVMQPHSQTANDRPIRMYGVLPLFVEEDSTRLRFKVSAPAALESGKPFAVDIQTEDGKPAQFTAAVVDEGLLVLTSFPTPDPWQAFFKKISLGVLTSDLFAYIIDANKGDVFKSFAVGGEVEEFRKQQLAPVKPPRFEPVSLFKGPLATDEKGRLHLTWKMPEYIGAVRLMAVGVRGHSYGQKEKSLPVKTSLMLLPTLPRVLGPEDTFTLPVTVFALNDAIKEVKVSLQASGPVSILGMPEQTLGFDTQGERDVEFRLKCQAAVGLARFAVTANSGSYSASSSSDVPLRPYSPRLYETYQTTCEPGKSVKVKVPGKGISGTNHAQLSVMRKSLAGLDRRLQWLIHYPYGCIEQTVSAVFPQLLLKDFIKNSSNTANAIDANINAGIQRLRLFQTGSGGFAFWPGEAGASSWGTNYAGHFLLEAKNLGYGTPPEMLQGWLNHQRSESLKAGDDLMERVYRVYLLALAGEPQMGAMNLLRENDLDRMNDCQKWLLAAAFQAAGVSRMAERIAASAGSRVDKYTDPGTTYGSAERDLAMILEAMVLLKRWTKAEELYRQLNRNLAGDDWYSTQTSGYMLLALGKYLNATGVLFHEENPRLAGTIVLADGKRIPFDTLELRFTAEITGSFGKEISVEIDPRTNAKTVNVFMDWNGVPLKPRVIEEANNLTVKVEWYDEDGLEMDPAQIPQGKSFWARIRVGKKDNAIYSSLQELALVQLIPSGWEIENLRLSGENVPGWMKAWTLNKEEYLDIRDDRIMWFFDMPAGSPRYDFAVKLHAVTAGEFVLPPTLFEAMYKSNYRAVQPGKKVAVSKAK